MVEVFSLRSLFGDDAVILRERSFQVLLLANVLGPMGTAIVSPALDSLIGPFGASPANIGLMISFLTAPGIVIYPIAGMLTDLYGRKPILVGALLLYGGAGTAIAFTTDYRFVLGLRLLQGIAFSGITPVIITSLGDRYKGTREATAQGIRFTGSGLSSAVFPLLSGVLVTIAWQYPFLLYAIAVPIAGLVYVWLDEPMAAGEEGMDVGETTIDRLRGLVGLLRQRRVFVMVVTRGLPNLVWFGFLTYNSLIVVELVDGTPTQAGLLAAVASFAYAGAASQAGRITAVFDSRLYPLVGANICLGAGLVLFVFAPGLVVAGLGTGIIGVGFGITLSLYRSIITDLASDSLRGGVVSISEAFGRVTATVTPIAMGAVIAVTTPVIGIGAALQVAELGVAVIGGVGGVISIFVLSISPEVTYSD